MTNARMALHYFDLASPGEREEIIQGLADRISIDEAKFLAKACHRCDIIGHTRMPIEVRLMIVRYLDIADLYNCCFLVSRTWKRLLIDCKEVAEDSLRKWFPCFYDKGMPMEDMLALFSQTVKKRYLRDTGRFQVRFTCKFGTRSNGEHLIQRLQGLHHSDTFRDLECCASLPARGPTVSAPPIPGVQPAETAPTTGMIPTSQRRETIEESVGTWLYANHRIAWQLRTHSPEPSVIFFHDLHDLHAQQPCIFRLPRQLIQGIDLRLVALGSELIVASAVGRREVYAQNLRTKAIDSVSLPATLNKCETQGQSSLITTVQGHLLLWTFQGGLAQIDITTLPPNQEAHPSRSQTHPRSKDRLLRPEKLRYAAFFFHPQDNQIFFVAAFSSPFPDYLSVYEFRGQSCSRIFDHSSICPIGMTSSKVLNEPEVSGDYWKTIGPIMGARKVDAHGTHKLLEFSQSFGTTERLICVMFNTLSTTFSVQIFAQCLEDNGTQSNAAFLWNGQLCLESMLHSKQHIQTSSPRPLAIHQPLKTEFINLRTHVQDLRQLATIQNEALRNDPTQPTGPHEHAGELPSPGRDIIRHEDIIKAYPHATDLCLKLGLLYMCSLHGGECSYTDAHNRDCSRYLPTTSSERTVASGTGTAWKPNDLSTNDNVNPSDTHIRAITGDDEFLIVITEYSYHVFAVDADRKITKSLTEGSDKLDNMMKPKP